MGSGWPPAGPSIGPQGRSDRRQRRDTRQSVSRIRTYKTEGVVLKQMHLGEADRILTLITPDVGKVRAVAKGVRRAKSKLGGHLELLNVVSVSISRGKSLDIVSEAEAVQTFRKLREDLHRLSKAIYMAELVDCFSTEQTDSHQVYLLLVDALGQLERTHQPDLLLRYFELHLLDRSGFRPELNYCVECRTVLEPGNHFFDCGVGGAVCPSCRVSPGETLIPLSLNAMKVLRHLQRGREYARVEGLGVSQSLMLEIERLLRVDIRILVERELKTTEFMTLVSSDRVHGAPP